MVIRVGKYHRLWSLKPVNYIIFGYRPSRQNTTAVSKTAFGFTFFAPALSRTYALEMCDGGYKLSLDGVLEMLKKCAESKFPMRTIGFPAYTYFLLKNMKEKGMRLKMPKGSMVTLGGGWKQFYAEKVDKQDFYSLVYEVLGIEQENVIEFFGAVEHPILYTDCKHHHFHIPVYSRVIIRNPDDFSPVKDGQPGLVNLLTPMVRSMPLFYVPTAKREPRYANVLKMQELSELPRAEICRGRLSARLTTGVILCVSTAGLLKASLSEPTGEKLVKETLNKSR